MAKPKIELQVIIHDTPAALRFGGDGYHITFTGTEQDVDQAVKLCALKKTRLKVSIEVDDEQGKDNSEAERPGSRPWLAKRRGRKADE